ncbi:asparagine synthase C-terminal domain-containing protein, partial [Flavobacteriaceae bacterium]|nr:asparagine synthase C-terminal domain-containing protein [Flavobacteriaceae bacterium]
GSNLKQIEICNNLKLRRESCINYFHFGYFIDPQTPYENVYKLEPGNFFLYDIEKNNLTIKKYWSVSDFSSHKNKSSYLEVKHNVKMLLTSAVGLRLKADVPVGLFLSGGVDSSLITSIAKSVKDDINTYSIKFDEKKYDESEESKKIANYLGTNHHTFSCDLNKGKTLIEDMFKFYDEPFADISSIPSMLLSSEVKKHVTVALTGDGADELFLGYDRYRWMNDVSNLYKVPYGLRREFTKALKLIPNYKLKMIAQGLSYKNIDELYLRMMSTFKTSYIKGEISSKISDKFHFPFKELNVIEACSLIDVNLYLNADVNTKVDRASMAYSLEARSPFMDHRVAEYSRTIPTEMKFKKRTSKYILKDLLSDYIPRDLFERPKKGFGVPLEFWLKKDLKPLVIDCLSSFQEMDLDFIDYKKFDKLIDEFYSNKANHSVEIWKMMSFVLWFNVTID